MPAKSWLIRVSQRQQDAEDEEQLLVFRRGMRSIPVSGDFYARYMRFLVCNASDLPSDSMLTVCRNVLWNQKRRLARFIVSLFDRN